MSTDVPPFVHTKEFKYTAPPNPGWTYGQGIEETPEGRAWAEGEKAGWKVIDTSTEDPRKLYGILLSGIVPRPVAFISSVSKDGVENLAPFSWFNQVSPSPPVLSYSCAHTSQGAKDSLRNVLETKGFTANIISEPWIEQANICSIDTPHDITEWPLSGLTKAPSIHVKAPRVKESAFSMECELLQTIDIVDPTSGTIANTLVLGSIKYIHMRNDIIDPERGIADPGKLKPIARLGGVSYTKVSEGYALPRMSWKDEEEVIRKAVSVGNDVDRPSGKNGLCDGVGWGMDVGMSE